MNLMLTIVGIGFLITTITLLILMFALFFIGRDISDTKRILEQTFVQTQLNNARLIGMERQMLYIYEVIKKEESAQAVLGAAAGQLAQLGMPGLQNPSDEFPAGTSFQTEDGSLMSDTFEGLLDKMTKDPRYKKPTKSDIDFLDGLFKKDEEDEEE